MIKELTVLLGLLFLPMIASAQDAATFHVFPQVADGRFVLNGNGFHTDFMITNVNDGATNCTLNLHGVPTSRLDPPGNTMFALPIRESAKFVSTNNSADDLIVTGYATLACDGLVTANAVYVESGPGEDGVVLALATVFSSPSASVAQLPLFLASDFQRLGLAVANDSDTDAQYDITVVDIFEMVVATSTLDVPARSSSAAFVSDIVSVPFEDSQFFGQVRISTTVPGTAFYAIGLYFVFEPHPLFTTFPATQLVP